MEKFDLAPAEWNIMECLWERAPQTGRELTEQLEASMGWSRSTTLTLKEDGSHVVRLVRTRRLPKRRRF